MQNKRITLRLVSLATFLLCQFLLWTAGSSIGIAQIGADPNLIKKAKAEGEVVWYATFTLPEAQKWTAKFSEKYGIRVIPAIKGAPQLTQTIQNEVAAGKWNFDLFLNHTTQMEHAKLKGWIQKMDYPEAPKFGKEFYDPNGYWVSFFLQPWVIAYNTNLVKRAEAPKSYEELLEPKWKGKIAFEERDVDLYHTLLKIMGPEKGPAFIRRLAAQNLSMRRGHEQTLQLLGAGEFHINASSFVSIVEVFKKAGMPVDWFADEPVPVSVRALGVSAKPRHPAAARLFFEWALSEEGQKLLDDMDLRIPARRDMTLKDQRLEALMKKKLHPVDPSIGRNREEVVREFRSIFMK